MHYIKSDDVEYTIPAKDIAMVFKITAYFRANNIEYTHYFED